MVSSFDTTPRDFWKTIGRTGVADNRNQKIPFEVYNEEGSLNTDPKSVLKNGSTTLKKCIICKHHVVMTKIQIYMVWVIYMKIKATQMPAIFVVQSLSGKSVKQSYTKRQIKPLEWMRFLVRS